MYQELGLESLPSRRWYTKLAMFYKIYKNKSPLKLFKVIPEKTSSYATKIVDSIPLIKTKQNFFTKKVFLPICNHWKEQARSYHLERRKFCIFKRTILKLIRPTPRSFLNCYKHEGIRLMTKLRLDLSHLRKHKFNHNLQKLYQSSL